MGKCLGFREIKERLKGLFEEEKEIKCLFKRSILKP